MNINIENHLLDSLLIALASDVPDEDLAGAVQAQAELMAGIDPCGCWEESIEIH